MNKTELESILEALLFYSGDVIQEKYKERKRKRKRIIQKKRTIK